MSFLKMSRCYRVCLALIFAGGSGIAAPQEFMVNPSFETILQGGLPEGFGWPERNDTIGAKAEVIRDVTKAKNGVMSVHLTTAATAGSVYLNLVESNPQNLPEALTASFYAKGKGEVLFQLTSKTGKRKAVGTFTSDPIQIDSKEWTRYELPLNVIREGAVNGEQEKALSLSFRLKFEGAVFLDDFNVIAAGTEIPADIYQAEVTVPFITVPASGRVVTIDGVPEPGEWDSAAGVTGFYTLGGTLSARQTQVYLTRDESSLYVRFHSPYSQPLQKGEALRDFNIRECDVAEVYLQAGGDVFHFLMNPAGGILDRKNREASWNGAIQYASTVVDSGETRGGVLTFAKGVWNAELAIPFSALEKPAPQKGDVWQMNFSRAFYNRNGSRTSEDWTTFVPNASLSRPQNLAKISFNDRVPAFQIQELGELNSGVVAVRAAVFSASPGTVDYQAAVLLNNGGNILMNQSGTAELTGTSAADIALNGKISSDQLIRATLMLAAKDRTSGELFYQLPIHFECSSSFEFKTVFNTAQRMLVSMLDLKNITESPVNLSVLIQVKNSSGATVASNRVTEINQTQIDFPLLVTELADGVYLAECELLDAAGKRLSLAVSKFTVEPPPSWLGNTIGIDNRIPPPFTPVRVDGAAVGVVLRDYQFADSGIPEQVTADGKPLFVKPPQINCVLNGAAVQSRFDAMKLMHQTGARVVYALKGQIGTVPVAGELAMEYDGFAEWTLTLPPVAGVTVDSLSLEFYYPSERALYAKAANGITEKRFRTLLDSDEVTPSEPIGGWLFNKGNWPWSGEFLHELLICDDERGFYVLNESDQYLVGPKRVEIEKSEGLTTVKYHLISTPHPLDQPLPYQLFWLAAPVKPLPEDPKKWNMLFGGSNTDLSQAMIDRIHVQMSHLVIPNLYKEIPKKEQALLKRDQARGLNVVPYWGLGVGPDGIDEYEKYEAEWEVQPVAGGSAGTRGGWKCTCTRSAAWKDFTMNSVKTLVEQYSVDGVYLDVSRAQGCWNPAHGCGYYDPAQKKRIQTINIKDTRDLFKRLYTYLKFSGKDRLVFMHGINPGSIGFCDVVAQGESWGHEKEKRYDRLTPDMFRTVVMRNMKGVPHQFYPFFYSWRAKVAAQVEPVGADEAFMLGLPFYTRPCVLGWYAEEIIAFWNLTDPWWTQMDFIGYWRAESPVRSDNPSVVASTYRKHDGARAMLGVSNFSHEQQTVTIAVDEVKLGFKIGRVKSVNPVGGKEDALSASSVIKLSIPPRSGRMVILEK